MESRFKLNYAPHIGLTTRDNGLFVQHTGTDPVEQIKFIGDQDFRAIEDNFLQARLVEVQERMAAELARRGMDMGCFVGTLVYDRPTFVVDDPDERERLLKELHTTVEVAKRMNGKWITTLGGYQDLRLPRSYQIANMIENLKWCGEVAERAGVTLLIESVNSQGWPGTFLTSIADAYLVVRAVNSPAVKLVFDVYHVQLEDGDLIQNIDRCWAEIAYFHLADNPGRLEPGTGEINFQNLLRHIQAKGYTGILDMEHGSSKPDKAGEQTVIDTYLALDQF